MFDMDIQKLLENIEPINQDFIRVVQQHLNQLTKPPESLGKLEQLAKQLAGITEQKLPVFKQKAVLVMAGDHGVCDEGISQYPQEVTAQMIANFVCGGAAVNVLARQVGADVFCVDIGSKSSYTHKDLLSRKVKYGTGNICKDPAMTEDEAISAISVGIDLVSELVEHGYSCFATGEMGIGNTTVSSALLCVMLEQTPEHLVGYGTGIDKDKKIHKQSVVERAVNRYRACRLYEREDRFRFSIELLSQLGGLEIAGLVGVILGAAHHKCPVVIDGFISTAAAVIASHLSPHCSQYMIPSHLSKEKGHRNALSFLKMEPLLQMDMRLGEGTGAVLCFPLLDASIAIVREMATFESAGIARELKS